MAQTIPIIVNAKELYTELVNALVSSILVKYNAHNVNSTK